LFLSCVKAVTTFLEKRYLSGESKNLPICARRTTELSRYWRIREYFNAEKAETS